MPQPVVLESLEAYRPLACGITASGPCFFGGGVLPDGVHRGVVSEGAELAVIGAPGIASLQALVHGSGGQVIQVGAGVGDAARRCNHGEELAELCGGGARGEDEDVLPPAQRMVGRGILDVGGVVEQCVAFHANVGRFVLAQAFHARSAGCGDGGTPFGAFQAPAAGVDRDAAVHDGDEVGIGEEVEGGSGPGPVYA